MENKYLEQSILATLCYFDIFDYPLTLMEVWQWFYTDQPTTQKVDLLMVKQALDTSDYLQSRISFKYGFYFLKNRESIVLTRLQRYVISDEKYQIAKKGVELLKFLPFIKLICWCNNHGNNNIKEHSDIDLFIVTTKNRLFTARFLVTLVIGLMRLRRHDHKITNRLCLSFYVAKDDLDFSKIKIVDDDIYFIYWIANLFPLYDHNIYDDFLTQNNWVKDYLPNYLTKTGSYWRRVNDHKLSRLFSKNLEYLLRGFFGGQLEKILKAIQLFKMSKNHKSLAQENDSRVIISNTMLKFHENDRRLFYRNIFLNKLKEII